MDRNKYLELKDSAVRVCKANGITDIEDVIEIFNEIQLKSNENYEEAILRETLFNNATRDGFGLTDLNVSEDELKNIINSLVATMTEQCAESLTEINAIAIELIDIAVDSYGVTDEARTASLDNVDYVEDDTVFMPFPELTYEDECSPTGGREVTFDHLPKHVVPGIGKYGFGFKDGVRVVNGFAEMLDAEAVGLDELKRITELRKQNKKDSQERAERGNENE